jgi:hypothetical protein
MLALEAGFQRIPSGALSDWRMAGSGRFRLADADTLESEGGSGVLWYAREQFDDFILKLDWRSFNTDDNSGVFLRIPALGNSDPANDWRPAASEGYEVQIDDRGLDPSTNHVGSPLHQTGAVYKLAAATELASRPLGEWNEFEVEAQGSRITVKLNDRTVSTLQNGNRRSRGFIGLQNHHPGSRVQFRNIRLKRL